ncbi:hypothetical protein NUZ5A_50275 [Candidatus Nitrosotenuis uzonensis]|uniref:Uncharacterized protein n=1 Tax=Candidatus Nitrosotenuis uzonensis TaxID=1407055 RepID=A0A812F6J7_9ARCH|nr:hypothetical protein NUZ5A_50275 [Candidatus Nitrosotenuis uzonensis]
MIEAQVKAGSELGRLEIPTLFFLDLNLDLCGFTVILKIPSL